MKINKCIVAALMIVAIAKYVYAGEAADCSYKGQEYSCLASAGAQPLCAFCPVDPPTQTGCNASITAVNQCCYEAYCN